MTDFGKNVAIAAPPLCVAFVRAPRAGLRLDAALAERALGRGRARLMATMPDGSLREITWQASPCSLESRYSGHILGAILADSSEEADGIANGLHAEWELPTAVSLADFFSKDTEPQSSNITDPIFAFRSESDDALFDAADHTLRGRANIDCIDAIRRIRVKYSHREVSTIVESAADPSLERYDVFASLAEEKGILQSVARQLRADLEWCCGSVDPSVRFREQAWIFQVAFDWDGKIAALRGSCSLNVGDTPVDHCNIDWAIESLSGPYVFPVTNAALRVVRSKGRPNLPTALQIRRGAVLGRERMMEAVARHLGLSGYVVRSRNLKRDFLDSKLWRSISELQERGQSGGSLPEGKGSAIACDGAESFFSVMQCRLDVDRATGRFSRLEQQCLWQPIGSPSVDGAELRVAPDDEQSVLLAPSVLGAVDDVLAPLAPRVASWPMTSRDLLASMEEAAHARYRILWKDCC